MPMPQTLSNLANQILNIVHADPNHQYNPLDRKQFYDWMLAAAPPTGSIALQWLSILSVWRVLPLYVPQTMSHLTELSVEEFSEMVENFRYTDAYQAVALAIQVMENKFSLEKARIIAGNTWYLGRESSSFQSHMIELAAIKALGDVTDYVNPLRFLPDSLMTPYYRNLIEDTTGAAAVAAAYVIDDPVIAEGYWGDAWNTWSANPKLDAEKLLGYWQWWLTKAISQAWQFAEAATLSTKNSEISD